MRKQYEIGNDFLAHQHCKSQSPSMYSTLSPSWNVAMGTETEARNAEATKASTKAKTATTKANASKQNQKCQNYRTNSSVIIENIITVWWLGSYRTHPVKLKNTEWREWFITDWRDGPIKESQPVKWVTQSKSNDLRREESEPFKRMTQWREWPSEGRHPVKGVTQWREWPNEGRDPVKGVSQWRERPSQGNDPVKGVT